MKKLAFLTVIVMMASLTFAQKVEHKDVPSAVKTAFQSKYPSVPNNIVKWDKEGKHYKAVFENNGVHHVLVLDDSGKMIRMRERLKEEDLPKKAKEHVEKNHPGEKIREIEKITDKDGMINYAVRIKEKIYYFDKDGNFVKEKIKDKEKDKTTK